VTEQAHLDGERSLDLASRIRAGDAAAEEELVRIFSRRVFAMAIVRTRDRELSRELVQDVLMVVIRALRSGAVRETQKIGAFVHGTTLNLIRNRIRQRARRPPCEELDAERLGFDPIPSLERSEIAQRARRAVDALEEADRAILRLTLVEGLKPGEIAARLGLGSDVVRQRKSRALRKVIALLETGSRN